MPKEGFLFHSYLSRDSRNIFQFFFKLANFFISFYLFIAWEKFGIFFLISLRLNRVGFTPWKKFTSDLLNGRVSPRMAKTWVGNIPAPVKIEKFHKTILREANLLRKAWYSKLFFYAWRLEVEGNHKENHSAWNRKLRKSLQTEIKSA